MIKWSRFCLFWLIFYLLSWLIVNVRVGLIWEIGRVGGRWIDDDFGLGFVVDGVVVVVIVELSVSELFNSVCLAVKDELGWDVVVCRCTNFVGFLRISREWCSGRGNEVELGVVVVWLIVGRVLRLVLIRLRIMHKSRFGKCDLRRVVEAQLRCTMRSDLFLLLRRKHREMIPFRHVKWECSLSLFCVCKIDL